LFRNIVTKNLIYDVDDFRNFSNFSLHRKLNRSVWQPETCVLHYVPIHVRVAEFILDGSSADNARISGLV